MKKLLTLISSFALAGALNAQLPDNSIAPDFMATDINGVQYSMYDIIESGKPVIMDISATWCGPCWSYHNSGALENLYDQYGPAGTNELMVLFVEGDGSTNTNCLTGSAGCNSSTQGNWVLNTPYPIIDDSSISESYDIGYYPTVYLICPDHLVKEVGQLNTAGLKSAADACPEPVNGVAINAIQFGTDYAFGKICGTQSVTPQFLVINGGTDALTSVVIELKVNGATVQTLDYTTSIPSFYPRMINFAPITLTGNAIIKATIKSLNGVTLTTPIVKQKSYQKAKATATQSLTLELKTDGYGIETYWELIDEQGNAYAAGGNENVGPNGANTGTPAAGPGAYANLTSYTETMEVPANGCYFLHMVDSYGDGMCTGGTGSYKLYETAAPANVLAEGGCDFANALNIFGAEGIVGVNTILEEGTLKLFPNPAKDLLNINFSLKTASDVQITVLNTLGQQVRNLGNTSFVAGTNNMTIETANLASGMYVINFRTAEGNIARTFTVQQ
jgi:hypothetical protein